MYIKYLNFFSEEYLEYYNKDNNMVSLNRMNIFIGKNNSGKSRLMRKILQQEFKKKTLINEVTTDYIELHKNIEELISENNNIRDFYNKTYLSKEKIEIGNKIYRNEEEEEQFAIFICNILYPEKHRTIYEKLQKKNIVKSVFTFNTNPKFPKISDYILKEKIEKNYNKIIESYSEIIAETIFFPSILSLRKLDTINLPESSNYNLKLSDMFLEDYFSNTEALKKLNIKTGQEVYEDMKKQLLGLSEDRKRFEEFENYIGKNFFDGEDIKIFVKGDDNNIYIKEGDEREYPIFLLGDGLQTLITITYYLYMYNNEPLKVFIDEPEIHLHPGLQRLLINKLLEYNNYQIFISTHSSSMIDICDEYDEITSIICVEKKSEKKFAYNSCYDNMNLYELIGVRPSSLILSNCTIWVEGPTDVYYIDTYLKLYSMIQKKKEYKVGYNYNYAFNGSINIASKIDFTDEEEASMKIKKISKNNFIIFDSDNLNADNKNYKKIKKIKKTLGNNCYTIEKLKTIENIIFPSILYEYYKLNYKPKNKKLLSFVLEFFAILEEEYNKDSYFEIDIPDSMAKYISKNLNERSLEEYKKYCKSLWNSNKSNLAIFFSNKIKNSTPEEQKQTFNNTMIEYINMIKNIYRFIDKNNKLK